MASQAMPDSAVASRRNSVVTLSRSLKVGMITDNCSGPVAGSGIPGTDWTASFMAQHISGAPDDAKRPRKTGIHAKTGEKSGQNRPQNANDHERRGARTSGATELFRGRPSAGAVKRRRRR